MDLKGMIELHLVVVLCMITLASGTIIVNISDVNKCDGQSESVMDKGGNIAYININSHCQCKVISQFSGSLVFKDNNTCQNKTDDNKALIITPCHSGHGKEIHFNTSDILFLIFKDFKSYAQSSELQRLVSIYAGGTVNEELFSVTCGLGIASTTTRPTSTTNTGRGTSVYFPTHIRTDDKHLRPSTDGVTTVTSTVLSKKATTKYLDVSLHTKPVIKNASKENMTNVYINSSEPDFPYMYVVGAGSIVVVGALIVLVFLCIRKRNRVRNTCKEDTRYKEPKNNLNLSEQELPDNPLYHAYQENEDGGYSTCGNENQSSTEQLPDNPLYHSYQVNNDEKDSKSKKDKSLHFPSQAEMTSYRNTSENVSDNNAVYAQHNKHAKVSIVNQIESSEGENETVYAQVDKTKKQ